MTILKKLPFWPTPKCFWKRLLGLTNIQVHNTVYNITERSKKLADYVAGYYEQELVDLETFKKQSTQNTFDHTLEKNVYSAKKLEIN